MPKFGELSMLPTGGGGDGQIKRFSVPEKGSIRAAVIRPTFAQASVHWVKKKEDGKETSTPYRCTGDGCALCERASGSQGVIGPLTWLTQIWTAVADTDGYTPGTLGLAPTAVNAINALAEAEGGAEALVGAEIELSRAYLSKTAYRVLVSLDGSADLDPGDISGIDEGGPTDEEMQAALGVPQPDNAASWARNLAAGKGNNSGRRGGGGRV